MLSYDVEIYEIMLENSSYSLTLERSKTRFFYVLDVDLLANSYALNSMISCFYMMKKNFNY